MITSVFGKLLGRAGLSVFVSDQLTRKMMPAVIGQMIQKLGRGGLPSTASLLRSFRQELGLKLRTQNFYNIVRPYQKFQATQQEFMERSGSAVMRRSDMIASPFAEKNKYRYLLGQDYTDPLTGEVSRKTLSITSDRLLSQDQLSQVIGPLGEEYAPIGVEFESGEWDIDFAYTTFPTGYV